MISIIPTLSFLLTMDIILATIVCRQENPLASRKISVSRSIYVGLVFLRANPLLALQHILI